MNRRLGMSLVLSGTLIGCAGLAERWAGAQEPPPPPPPPQAGAGVGMVIHDGGPDGDVMYGSIGGPIELLGFEGMHGGKVVTGAPFSAVAVSETMQTLSDGNHISRKTTTNLFRDSQGRIRREVTLPAIGPLATSGEAKSFVSISDPVAGTHFILHPESKTAEQMGAGFARMHGPMKGAMKDAIKGKMEHWQQQEIASGDLKKEDLGTQTIAGVRAQGTRITRTIPAGQIGNEKPITVVSEHWYSNDLQMTVMSKRSDPRFGETTYTLTSIQRSEPNASLFAVPADYTVKPMAHGRHVIREFQQEPAEPAPPPPSDN